MMDKNMPVKTGPAGQAVPWKEKIREKSRDVMPILLALVGGIVIGGILMLAAGHNPFTTYFSLIYGAVGDRYNLSATLGRAIPIIGCGIAAAIASTSAASAGQAARSAHR